MQPDRIQGFAFAVVVTNDDPEGTGRIIIAIPGIIEPRSSYWVMPACWPGAGQVHKGSQYPPPPQGSQVMVIFEHGIYRGADSRAVYLTGYYGLDSNGSQAGPPVLNEATSAQKAQQRVVLWEGASLVAYLIEDDEEEKLVLKAKATGSKIEINAKDGQGGKSESIYIEARTLLSLYARGTIDIRADGAVQIQGRRVDSLTTRSL